MKVQLALPLWPLTAAALLLLAIAADAQAQLPDILLREPNIEDYRQLPSTSGNISDRDALASKPRIIIGYLSNADWALAEFISMMHASWVHVNAEHNPSKHKIDLLVFAHPRWSSALQLLCKTLNLRKAAARRLKPEPQCFYVLYPTPPAEIWHGYPFINNVHYFADPLLQAFLTKHYGYAMKTDLDAFLTPAFVEHFPSTFLVGKMEFVVVPSTSEKLLTVSEELEIRHRGQHNIGPTWYGDVTSLIHLANLSIPIMHHIYARHFDHVPGGGLVQQWRKGEGWPEWSGGAIAMYATELAANHLFDQVEITDRLDHHSDTQESVQRVLQIHCRHGSKDFDKFTFLRSHYDGLDLAALEPDKVSGYASRLAVFTWRQLNGGDGGDGGGGGGGGGAKSEL